MRLLRNFIAFIVLSISFVSLAEAANNSPPTLASINIIDRNGFTETISSADRLKQYAQVDFLKNQPYQKVLRIFNRDQRGNIRAIITSYHPNGQPKQYLEVINNRAYGPYFEWYPNGIVKLHANVISGTADIDDQAEKTWLFNGCSRAWNESGNLMAEIYYSNGAMDGMATYYHNNGSVWKQVPMSQGRIEGTMTVYLENGNVMQSNNYAAGQRNGSSKRYWHTKQIAADETYRAGLLQSGHYYSINGDLISDVEDGSGHRPIFSKEGISEMQEYQGGVQAGEVKVFDANGVLISVHHVKNGNKHGEEIEYYEPSHVDDDLTPRLSLNWYEGKVQGIVRTWYPDGTQESQREMSNNKKNGLFTAWYEDGSVMMIEDYDHGKLKKGEYYTPGEKIPVSLVNNGKGTATLYDSRGNLLRKITYYNGKPVVE